mgnify:CR=1 FL=1
MRERENERENERIVEKKERLKDIDRKKKSERDC